MQSYLASSLSKKEHQSIQQNPALQGMNPSTSSSMIPTSSSMQTTTVMNMCLPRDAHDDYPGYGFAVRRNHSLLLFDKETRFFYYMSYLQNNNNNLPPAFDADPYRRLYFRREFGPVATDLGFIDIRLRRGISILLTLDRAILVDNGQIRVAVSSDAKLSSLDHPNGRVRQIPERVDIIAFDGFNKNDFV